MNGDHPVFLFLLGLVVVLAMLVKHRLERVHLPPLLGYLLLGLLGAVVDDRWPVLTPNGRWALELLGEVGVAFLLFRVGLSSNPRGLLRQLPRVVPTWISNVLLSALLGYAAARWLLGAEVVPSLIVGIALSATSLGVTVGVWTDAGVLRSDLGERLVDVAELDDLSTVVLTVLLFSALPVVGAGEPPERLRDVLLAAASWLSLKGLLFGGGCLAFARWGERPLTAAFLRLESGPDPALAVAATGLIIAALAGWLGFSVAVGALFAGLLFSRDPATVKLQPFFVTLYDLFTPFFFLGIGLQLRPAALGAALGPGLLLLGAAVAGKLVGTALPVWRSSGPRPALLLGVSMIPRAEIALFVVVTVKAQHPWAVSDALYGALVCVSAATCLITPLLVRALLARWSDHPALATLPEEPAEGSASGTAP